MISRLLSYVLKHREKSPYAKFYENELRCISSPDFDALRNRKWLLFDQHDIENEPYFDSAGNERFVRKIKGRYVAVSAEHPDITPLILKDKDLSRYTFNIQAFAAHLNQLNRLGKSASRITDAIYFIGERECRGEKTGIYLGLFENDAAAKSELFSLKILASHYPACFIVCPTFALNSQDLISRLTNEGVFCRTFTECMDKDMRMDFARSRGHSGAKTGTPTPAKLARTPKEDSDYREFGYKTDVRIHLTGKRGNDDNTIVEINGEPVRLPDYLFILLLQLVISLKKTKDGRALLNITEGKYQIVSDLRKALKQGIRGTDAKDIIENMRAKQYRLSTHPNYATYDRKTLLKHPNARIAGLAKQLPLLRKRGK